MPRSSAARALESPLREDPVLAALRRAPREHEPVSDEELAAVAAAKASPRWISHAEIEAGIEARRLGG